MVDQRQRCPSPLIQSFAKWPQRKKKSKTSRLINRIERRRSNDEKKCNKKKKKPNRILSAGLLSNLLPLRNLVNIRFSQLR